MKVIQFLAPDANTRRGAPMGRADKIGDRGKEYKLYLRKLPLFDGGYDRGGAYWGTPSNLYGYVSSDGESIDGEVYGYLRAGSRQEAKETIKRRYPNARFYR